MVDRVTISTIQHYINLWENLVIKIVRKFFRVVKASIGMVKAFDLASKNQFQDSLEALRKIEYLLNGKIERFHILKSLVLLKAGDFEGAIKSGEIAVDLIDKNAKLNSNERTYLKVYTSLVCGDAYELLGEEGKAENMRDSYLDVSIEMSKVADRLKRRFPLIFPQTG